MDARFYQDRLGTKTYGKLKTKPVFWQLWECPPSGQGITALVAANILRGMDISSYPHGSAQHFHMMIEAIRLAFADTRYYVADPAFTDVPSEGMIAPVQKHAFFLRTHFPFKIRSSFNHDRLATNAQRKELRTKWCFSLHRIRNTAPSELP